MAQLTVTVPTPSVDFSKGRSGNGMPVAAFYLVNTFTSLLKTANQLWNIIRISVAQPQLPVLIVFTNRIDKSLETNKETKVVSA